MKTIILLVVLVFSLGMSSCKKDIISASSAKTNSIKKVNPKSKLELKSWFDSHNKLKTILQSRDPADSFDLPDVLPEWDSTTYYPDGQVYKTPIKDNGTIDPKTIRTLALTVDEDGYITGGEYVLIHIWDQPNNLTVSETLENYAEIRELQNMPANFKGSIIKYNLDKKIIYSYYFHDGMVTPTNEKYKSIERAPVPTNPEGGIEICYDYWWVTYNTETGEIISIEYDGTECYIVTGGGGGGSSGTGGGSTVTCEQLNEQFASLGSVQSGPVHAITEWANSSEESKIYDWLIYQAGTWGLLSYERAKIKLTSAPNGGVIREFIEMSHVAMSAAGMVIGGERSFQYIDAVFNKSSFRVDETIYFSVTSKADCNPITGPLTTPYNASKTFRLVNTVTFIP